MPWTIKGEGPTSLAITPSKVIGDKGERPPAYKLWHLRLHSSFLRKQNAFLCESNLNRSEICSGVVYSAANRAVRTHQVVGSGCNSANVI